MMFIDVFVFYGRNIVPPQAFCVTVTRCGYLLIKVAKKGNQETDSVCTEPYLVTLTRPLSSLSRYWFRIKSVSLWSSAQTHSSRLLFAIIHAAPVSCCIPRLTVEPKPWNSFAG